MKILVVSDNFSKGGLETQINTYYNNLPNNIEFVFAFGKYTKTDLISGAKIYQNFNFSFNDTILDFCEDVERLISIIKEEDIDVIHVHPYYGFFAALFASQITKTKIVYTYHGIGSFNFTKTHISQPLFLYSFESGAISNVFSVSEIGVNNFSKIGYNNAILLENPIDLKQFPIANYVNNKKWLLISRIDSDKIGEIKLIISKMSNYDIKYIDILGDGNEFDNLNERILLIATTNLYKQFDKALLRRFDYIVDFNRYSKEDLEEIADTIITSELKKYSNVKPEYKILNKIYNLVETLPYPGDLKNIIRSSIAFSDMTMEYGYLSKIYETITNEKLTNDLKKLQEQGFSVREIEKLTGISKSSVSRGINNE